MIDGGNSIRRAFGLLRDATQFESAYIGAVGAPSCNAIAFQVILEADTSDLVFKALLQEATLVGKLYALCGVYFTDPDFFAGAVNEFREQKDFVIPNSEV